MNHDKEYTNEHIQSDEYSFLQENEIREERFFHEDEFNRDAEIGLNRKESFSMDENANQIKGTYFLNRQKQVANKIKKHSRSPGLKQSIQPLRMVAISITAMISTAAVVLGHEHVYHWFIQKNPTCIETGKEVYQCETCNHISDERSIPQLEHQSSWRITTEATCQNEGIEELLCSLCETSLDKRSTGYGNHIAGEWTILINPTCTSDGQNTLNCELCQTTLETEKTAALGHKEQIIVSVSPTCIHTGLTEGIRCIQCNEILTKQTVLPALGHTEILIKGLVPTCTSDGLTEGTQCQTCGQIISGQTVISALGHQEIIDAGYAPTCTTPGLSDGSHCSTCNEILIKQEEIPPQHQIVILEGIEPTCIDEGLTEGEYCSSCNEVLKSQQSIEPLGHIEVIDEAVDPTCTDSGLSEGLHCERCSEILVEQNVVDALGHAYGQWLEVTAPTEETEGLLRRTCANNSDHIEEIILPILAQNGTEESAYLIDPITEPTCTDEGSTLFIYTVDNQTFEYETVQSPIGHEYGDWILDARASTETEGLLTRTCANNPEHIEEIILPVLIQDNVDSGFYVLKTETEPTCTDAGYGTYTHTTDNDQSFSFPANLEPLGHIEVIDEAVDPTCTDSGLSEGLHCERCSEILVEQNVVDALGHAYGQWLEVTAPTEETEGLLRRTCANNSDHIEEIILPILAQNETEESAYLIDPITEPTCTDEGSTLFIYTVDNQTFEYETVQSPIGHEYGDWILDARASTETEGLLTRTCANNPEHIEEIILPVLIQDNVDSGFYVLKTETEPTCTDAGYGTYTHTTDNDQSFSFPANLEPLGHIEVIDEAVDPTCTDSGLSEGLHCERCSEILVEQNVVDALGHAYGQWLEVTAPTEETEGLLRRTCANNSDHIEEIILPILAQNDTEESAYLIDPITEPTCTDEGSTLFIYTVDNQTFEYQLAVAPLGHDYNNWSVAIEPTNEASGLLTRYCMRDQAHYEEQTIPALTQEAIDSGFYTYLINSESTCIVAGSATYMLTIDDENMFRFVVELPLADHNWIHDDASGDPNAEICSICQTPKP